MSVKISVLAILASGSFFLLGCTKMNFSTGKVGAVRQNSSSNSEQANQPGVPPLETEVPSVTIPPIPQSTPTSPMPPVVSEPDSTPIPVVSEPAPSMSGLFSSGGKCLSGNYSGQMIDYGSGVTNSFSVKLVVATDGKLDGSTLSFDPSESDVQPFPIVGLCADGYLSMFGTIVIPDPNHQSPFFTPSLNGVQVGFIFRAGAYNEGGASGFGQNGPVNNTTSNDQLASSCNNHNCGPVGYYHWSLGNNQPIYTLPNYTPIATQMEEKMNGVFMPPQTNRK